MLCGWIPIAKERRKRGMIQESSMIKSEPDTCNLSTNRDLKPIPEKHAASSLSQWGFMLFEDIDKRFRGGLHLLPRIRNFDRPRFSYSCLICQQPYCCCKHLNLLPLLPLLPSSLPFSKNKRQNLRPFSGLIPAPLPGHKPHPCCKYLCLGLCLSLSSPPDQPTMWKQILQ